ncbi:MAG TPA: carbamoyltransferase N-terminal domain-containing protein [Longimicrobiaceae bacterium]|nr:carbamoyltransferase N-terminal domain-containing protein [Longimicrobiaceae bacterium]
MRILGISCFYHDAAAALVEDGVVVAAAQEERFTRRKHDPSFPRHAIDFCLRRAGVAAAEVDYAVFYEKPLLKLERIVLTALRTFPRSWRAFGEFAGGWAGEKLWVKARIQEALGIGPERVLFTEHHAAHAASAFFCSPYREAAVLTVDGVGEWTTTAAGAAVADWEGGGRSAIDLDREIRFPHSLGLLYSAFTAWLGFEVNEGEYKVMGMAAYGEPRHRDRVEKVVRVDEDGGFELDLDYFAFPYSAARTYSRRFEALFGPPRDPRAPFAPGVGADRYYADVAASVQAVLEDALLKAARHLHARTGHARLCLAGGVALNAVANGRLLRETPFEELFIQPAAGDAGGAVGAALYACHAVLGRPRRYVMEHAYLGEEYPDGEAVDAFRAAGLSPTVYDDQARLVERVAGDLAAGRVVGWAQGRFEWGPRALGNRSILADPRRAETRDVVNEKIKFREPFRPFAPAVLEERAAEFFALDDPPRHHPARHMLLVVPWRPGMSAAAPAVDHAGTARLQTVPEGLNPRFRALVSAFDQATGVPMLLNTSFNLRGEPIVASPADALSTFARSGLDVLVCGNAVVRKEDAGG